MDNRGNVYTAEQVMKIAEAYGLSVAEVAAQERFIDIPEEELPKVQAMNRKQRRAWYAQERRRLRAERKAGG